MMKMTVCRICGLALDYEDETGQAINDIYHALVLIRQIANNLKE